MYVCISSRVRARTHTHTHTHAHTQNQSHIQVPDLDVVVIPVGGAGLIAGMALAIKTLRPNCMIIGMIQFICILNNMYMIYIYIHIYTYTYNYRYDSGMHDDCSDL